MWGDSDFVHGGQWHDCLGGADRIAADPDAGPI